MKLRIIITVIVTAVIVTLAACAGMADSKLQTKSAQNTNNVETKPLASVVLDWNNRNLGEDSMPSWIRPLTRGNTQVVRQEFGIPANSRIKYSVAQRANREEARVLAGLNFNQQIAYELKTYVVTASAGTLNQGQMEIVDEITTSTKINITGNERVADFWQLVETTDNVTGAKTREYLYYIVWAMNNNIWDQLVRKYVNDVIGVIPDRQVQVNIANAYNEISAASKRENELTDREFELKVQQQHQAAENAHKREMAQIRGTTQIGVAEAKAEAAANAAASYAAYRSGDPIAIAAAAARSSDIDWIDALRTVASIP